MDSLLERSAPGPGDAPAGELRPAPFPHAIVLAVLAVLGLVAFAFWHPVGYELFLGRIGGAFCL